MRRKPYVSTGPAPERRIVLTQYERRVLRSTSRANTLPFRDVQRARLILQLHRRPCVAEAARMVGMNVKTARRRRDRFLDHGRLDSLEDRRRSGRPPHIEPVTRCQIIAMACGRPADFGVKCRDVWTSRSLHQRFLEIHPEAGPISRTSVHRILCGGDIRPHHIKMWLHSPDPLFREKVTDICQLYVAPPPGEIVLCVDEKTGMQALGRKHPVSWPTRGRPGRMDYEYKRNGTRKLLAVFNPHTGEVYGEVRPTRTADDLVDVMEEVAKRHPLRKVHIIWDNLNTHSNGPNQRWTKFNARHGNRFYFHYTPIHASWVNQIELWFGILQRRVLRYGVFHRLAELDNAVTGFIAHWNKDEAHPFRWTFKGYPLHMGKKVA